MSPGDPALALPLPAPDQGAVPDYVQSLERAASYLPDAQRAQLRRAWAVGAAAHAGQTRKSGEPYITHPVAVAPGAGRAGPGHAETLVAAILHDTIEDTPLSRHAAGHFGETVAELVDGVTKLDKLRFADRQEAAAESFRKMLLAMARDLRVILIKLADRLHNMRTLGAQSAEARRRIAVETLEIFAPIAQRLGMNLIKSELQDLGFRALHPWRHAVIEKRIRSQPVVRREALAQIEARLAQKLALEKLPHRLVGRIKTPWSIYTKMHAENRSFDQVMDVFGYRVIVDNVPDCYHALGVVHSVYKPLDARFRDFIAIPKANGYQSLHTVLFGPYGSPIEVQIRTREMDLVAERGVAAHWAYKHGGDAGNSAQSRASAWIAGLVESQRGTGSSLEFLENVKVDLFPDEVYLFTPKGDIMALAAQFHRARFRLCGAYRRRQPRSRRAGGPQAGTAARATGQRPDRGDHHREVGGAGPAVAGIRGHRQGAHRDPPAAEAPRARGCRARRPPHAGPRAGRSRHLAGPAAAGAARRLPGGEPLPAAGGAAGRHRPGQPHAHAGGVRRWRRNRRRTCCNRTPAPGERILITGSERGVISFAQCCLPIPGDEIMGYHSAGKGIVVHRLECPNVPNSASRRNAGCRSAGIREVSGRFRCRLADRGREPPGVLAQVAAAIAQAESNIDRVEYLERDTRTAAIRFLIEVSDRKHLAEVMRRIRRLGVVHGVGSGL
jgi:guanosine-3',5'-bis(diphosphate) 3'-pyrophosphohydrolase